MSNCILRCPSYPFKAGFILCSLWSMAASYNFLLLPLILLLSSCFSAVSSDPLVHHDVSAEVTGSHQRVELSVYYEALCPYCGNFILNQLVELFKTDIVQVVDLKLIPWGNASVKDKSVITCQVIKHSKKNINIINSWRCHLLYTTISALQHGPDECRLNTMEACIIQTWPDFVSDSLMISSPKYRHL